MGAGVGVAGDEGLGLGVGRGRDDEELGHVREHGRHGHGQEVVVVDADDDRLHRYGHGRSSLARRTTRLPTRSTSAWPKVRAKWSTAAVTSGQFGSP